MSIIEKKNKDGVLYVSDKTKRMAFEYNGEVISEQEEVWDTIERERIPVKVQFEITEKCNLNCYYCYAKSLRGIKDISLLEVKQIIDKLDEMGILFLEITGGEPLARADFLEILKYINTKNFILTMITNGVNLTEEIVKELKNSKIDYLRISLLAPTEQKCDELTKVQGSFSRLKKSIELLKKYEIRFQVTSVITNQNVKQYEDYKKLERSLGVQIGYGINVGASFTGFDEVSQYALCNEDIVDLKPFVQGFDKARTTEMVCSAGKSKFAITNQGEVLPCIKHRVSLGNFLEDSFDDMWNSLTMKDVLQNQLVKSDECKSCDKRDFCEAVCPAEYKLYETREERCNTASLIEKAIVL